MRDSDLSRLFSCSGLVPGNRGIIHTVPLPLWTPECVSLVRSFSWLLAVWLESVQGLAGLDLAEASLQVLQELEVILSPILFLPRLPLAFQEIGTVFGSL